MDQGSTMKRSAVHNFAPTVTKFCVMWERQALPHDTKFGNSRCAIVGRRVIFIWSLIHGLRWSGLIKAEPGIIRYGWLPYLARHKSFVSSDTYSCNNIVNSFPPGQNVRHFVDEIFRCIFGNEIFILWLKFHWCLLISIQLTLNQHWFR